MTAILPTSILLTLLSSFLAESLAKELGEGKGKNIFIYIYDIGKLVKIISKKYFYCAKIYITPEKKLLSFHYFQGLIRSYFDCFEEKQNLNET